MKPAQQWLDEVSPRKVCGSLVELFHVDHIKAIQADALESAASEIVEGVHPHIAKMRILETASKLKL